MNLAFQLQNCALRSAEHAPNSWMLTADSWKLYRLHSNWTPLMLEIPGPFLKRFSAHFFSQRLSVDVTRDSAFCCWYAKVVQILGFYNSLISTVIYTTWRVNVDFRRYDWCDFYWFFYPSKCSEFHPTFSQWGDAKVNSYHHSTKDMRKVHKINPHTDLASTASSTNSQLAIWCCTRWCDNATSD